MKRYRAYTPLQPFILPPSPGEWLPEGHLVFFVLSFVEQLDLSDIERRLQGKDPRGERPYSPVMMVGLLLYGYATGVFSSRRLQRATVEDVAFRVLAAGEHPHFTTINQFRADHREARPRAGGDQGTGQPLVPQGAVEDRAERDGRDHLRGDQVRQQAALDGAQPGGRDPAVNAAKRWLDGGEHRACLAIAE